MGGAAFVGREVLYKSTVYERQVHVTSRLCGLAVTQVRETASEVMQQGCRPKSKLGVAVTVEDPRTVDIVSICKETGAVHLTIAAHLPWTHEQLAKLQAKMNAYLAFIQSGEIYATYPQSRDRAIVIEVVAGHRPDATALEFLERATSFVRNAGCDLIYRPLSSGYAEDDA
jgi:hypothetical protein